MWHWISIACAFICVLSILWHQWVLKKLAALHEEWKQTIFEDWKRRGIE